MTPVLTRRAALLGLGSAVALGRASLAMAAADTDRRFVVVLLRGAMDGLSAVAPYGDPNLSALRASLALPQPGQPGGLLDLGGMFGLHPSLAGLHGLYKSGEMLPLHAVAGPTRSRSHFEAQDCLESGSDHRLSSGWLNRAVQALPVRRAAGGEALAVGVSMPLLLRGPAPVSNWAPSGAAEPSPELFDRILAVHAGDRLTSPVLQAGLRERGFSAETLNGTPVAMPTGPRDRNAFPALAGAAGKLLAAADGPRVAALEIGGWDTHNGQLNRLGNVLGQLDRGLMALKDGLGPAWSRTAVLVMTEFGRTARANGTNGTDHGTGSVAFVLGGAAAGGKVRADWPGLGPDRLLDNRDLRPTADLRSVGKGLLADHLGLSGTALASVFPDSATATPMRGLLRT